MAFSRRSRGGLPPDDADDDLDFEPIILSQPRRRTGLWLGLFGLLALGGAAGGGWYFLDGFLGESVDTSVPLIRADIAPIKVRPENPGGMQVPDQDKLVYDRMQGEAEAPQVEQLLPPPETPLPLPAPPPPPQVDLAGDSASAAETEVAEAAIAEAVSPQSAPAAVGQPIQPAPAGPISLVPERPSPTHQPKPMETAEQLLPEPEKSKPVETATAPPPKPVETKPIKLPEMPPEKPATTVVNNPPKPKPVPPPPKKAAKPTLAYQIQIAAVRSPSRARGEWKRLQHKHRSLLGNLKLSIIKADLGPKKGIYYRLRAGPVADEPAARSLCVMLKKRKVGCLVVRPKG